MRTTETKLVPVPDSVQTKMVEVQDELNWLISEFGDLLRIQDLAEFKSVLDSVMDYVEDLHSTLESLEKLVGGVK